MKEFKAGDFTSGKMSEIFKHCFTEESTTVINHKQHGKLFMIPERYMAFMVNRALHQNKHFNDFLKSEYPKDTFDNHMPVRADIICDYLCISCDDLDWSSVMNALLLYWGKSNA